jgi:hypothetical protein
MTNPTVSTLTLSSISDVMSVYRRWCEALPVCEHNDYLRIYRDLYVAVASRDYSLSMKFANIIRLMAIDDGLRDLEVLAETALREAQTAYQGRKPWEV